VGVRRESEDQGEGKIKVRGGSFGFDFPNGVFPAGERERERRRREGGEGGGGGGGEWLSSSVVVVGNDIIF
jgi:hypothetical protein